MGYKHEEEISGQSSFAHDNGVNLMDNIRNRGDGIPDRPITIMDEHCQSLSSVTQGFERVEHQLNNLLGRMRGVQPAIQETDNVGKSADDLVNKLRMHDNRLHELCQLLNSEIDELNNLI